MAVGNVGDGFQVPTARWSSVWPCTGVGRTRLRPPPAENSLSVAHTATAIRILHRCDASDFGCVVRWLLETIDRASGTRRNVVAIGRPGRRRVGDRYRR